jgi:hypothetical protein
MGESGSPSICTTLLSRTKMFWPQPTAQYGQTDLTTASAVEVRGVVARVLADVTEDPRPVGSPDRNCRRTGHSRGLNRAMATRYQRTPR